MKTVGAMITLLSHTTPEQEQYLRGYSDALDAAGCEKFLREGNAPLWKVFYWVDQLLIEKAKDMGVFDEANYEPMHGRTEWKTHWKAVHEKTGKVYVSKKRYGSSEQFLTEEEEFYNEDDGKFTLTRMEEV